MRTVFIYETPYPNPIQFFELEGSYVDLDGVYINVTQDFEKVEKLFSILLDWDGNFPVKMLDKFPEQSDTEFQVVVVGLL